MALEHYKTLNATFKINQEGNIVCGGLFGDQAKQAAKGAFMLVLDPKTGVFKQKSFNIFEPDFIIADWSEEFLKGIDARAARGKGERALVSYKMQDLLLLENGEVVLIAEYSNESTIYYSANVSGSKMKATTTYYYRDILVLCFDAKGVNKWNSKVTKKQSTDRQINFLLLGLHVSQDKIHFLFNDNPQNFPYQANYAANESYGSLYSSTITLATIDAEGKRSYQKLFPDQENGVVFDQQLFWSSKKCRNIALYIGRSDQKNGKSYLSMMPLTTLNFTS